MKNETQIRRACANLDASCSGDYEDGSNETNDAWMVRLALAWVLDEDDKISNHDGLEFYLWMERGELLKEEP